MSADHPRPEPEILRRAEAKAAASDRTLSEVVKDALTVVLASEAPTSKPGTAADFLAMLQEWKREGPDPAIPDLDSFLGELQSSRVQVRAPLFTTEELAELDFD